MDILKQTTIFKWMETVISTHFSLVMIWFIIQVIDKHLKLVETGVPGSK